MAFYRDSDGSQSRSLEGIKCDLRYLKQLFGTTLLGDFGPPELKQVRQSMIQAGRVRRQINKRIGTIRQFFRWCVEEQLIPVTVLDTLKAVATLSPGRSGVPEGKPREPADPMAVDASLPYLSPAVRAIVLLLRHTGARPTEILTAKPEQIDRTGDVWKYKPADHKTSWKGKTRVIFFGPEARAVLTPWIASTQLGGVHLLTCEERSDADCRPKRESEDTAVSVPHEAK